MSWRERWRKASFRGVEFEIESGAKESGRRHVVHEYPKRNEPFTEDLGRRARHYPVTGYIVGPDYDRDAKRLLEACEKDGAGTLVHPTLGERRVICDVVGMVESKDQGGMAIFDMQFVEAGRSSSPAVGVATISQIVAAAAGLIGAAQTHVNGRLG